MVCIGLVSTLLTSITLVNMTENYDKCFEEKLPMKWAIKTGIWFRRVCPG